jgi:hypothetical protein
MNPEEVAKSDGIRPCMASRLGMQGIHAQNGPPAVLAGVLVASLPTVALFPFLRAAT